MPLNSAEVPAEFCERCCCTWRGGRCLRREEDALCLWSADEAAGFIEGLTRYQRARVTRAIHDWHGKLLAAGARKWGDSIKTLPWRRFMK